MTRSEILDRVRRTIRAELECDLAVDEASELLDDLQLDSLQRLTLSVALENDFEICFDPDEEQELVTVGDVVDLLERETAGREGSADARET
ncbi:MAG: phosphopantetheine-binding protein [Myxococcota bacterium]